MFDARTAAELPEWVETLQQDNVRALSVLLITDLLRIEENRSAPPKSAIDMTALVEDLLMSGDFANSALVLARAAQGERSARWRRPPRALR